MVEYEASGRINSKRKGVPMKKLHFILLLITGITALFSAYSLAAINHVYKVSFEWYSPYQEIYTGQLRDVLFDRWNLPALPEGAQFKVATALDSLGKPNGKESFVMKSVEEDANEYVFIYASLGETNSPEFRLKIVKIAQRGSVVEIKTSLNSPLKAENEFMGSQIGRAHV